MLLSQAAIDAVVGAAGGGSGLSAARTLRYPERVACCAGYAVSQPQTLLCALLTMVHSSRHM